MCIVSLAITSSSSVVILNSVRNKCLNITFSVYPTLFVSRGV